MEKNKIQSYLEKVKPTVKKVGLIAIAVLSLVACELLPKLPELPSNAWKFVHWGR